MDRGQGPRYAADTQEAVPSDGRTITHLASQRRSQARHFAHGTRCLPGWSAINHRVAAGGRTDEVNAIRGPLYHTDRTDRVALPRRVRKHEASAGVASPTSRGE